jgi:PAS domain S-box-containing protein
MSAPISMGATRSFKADGADVKFHLETGLLSSIIDSWDGLIYVGNPDLRIRFMNRRFIDQLGRDATGEHCFRALHGRSDACPWCPQEVFEGQTVRGRYQKPADGRWYDVTNTPLPLPDGTFGKVAFIRESFEPVPVVARDLPVFQNIVDRLGDAVFLLAPEDGRVLYANDTACAYLGYRREELLEMRVGDFCEAVAPPGGWGGFLSRLRTDAAAVLETRHRRSDGALLDVEVKAVSVLAGLQPFIVSVARDISERKRAETLLTEERNKVEAIMAALGDGITVQDRDFRIIYQNEVQIHRWGEHLGEHCYRIYADRDRVCDDCQAEKSFADGRIHHRLVIAETPEGLLHHEVTACPLRDGAGNIVACVEVVRDITDQKRMEQELQESNEKYRLLFSAESDAILTWDAETGGIHEVNDRACRLYGLSREEFASRRWPDLLADREEEVIDRLGSALHRRGDGSLFPVEFSTGSFQWQGRARVVAVVRDITERRRPKPT